MTQESTDTAATERRELDPCPFCGSKLISLVPDKNQKYAVSCEGCYCIIGEGYDKHGAADNIFANEYRAVRAWNTRVNSDRALEAERDALAQHLRGVAAMLKETGFAYHVEAGHRPAFAVCANVTCSQACYTWTKLNEKAALGETK
jgi:transcription elongation factor Elf1